MRYLPKDEEDDEKDSDKSIRIPAMSEPTDIGRQGAAKSAGNDGQHRLSLQGRIDTVVEKDSGKGHKLCQAILAVRHYKEQSKGNEDRSLPCRLGAGEFAGGQGTTLGPDHCAIEAVFLQRVETCRTGRNQKDTSGDDEHLLRENWLGKYRPKNGGDTDQQTQGGFGQAQPGNEG